MIYKDFCQVKLMLASLNQLEESVLQGCQMHMNHAMVLCVIFSKGPQTPTALSKELHVSPPRISRLLNSLVQDRFIERVSDQTDQRSRSVVLTTLGKKKAQEIQRLEKKLFPWSVKIEE